MMISAFLVFVNDDGQFETIVAMDGTLAARLEPLPEQQAFST